MKRLLLNLACICAVLILAQSSWGASVANYTSWTQEYDGSSVNTIALYNFNEDQVYVKWDGHSADEVLKGRTNTWMAYTKDSLDSAATFAADGKFGWGLHNAGGTDSTDFVRGYQSKDLFPVEADPSLTVELWVRFNDLTQSLQYLVDKRYSDLGGFELYVSNGSDINFALGDGTQTMKASAALSWQTGVFYHIAGTWDADTDTMKIYRDGAEVASVSYPGSVIVNSPNREIRLTQRLGASYGALNGAIDGLRISNIAYEFAQPEIQGPYYGWMNEYDGTSANTIALYHFNESDVYEKWDGHSADEILKGRTNTWMAYTKDNLDSAATFGPEGKFGWGLSNGGGVVNTDFVRLYQSANLFPAEPDPSLSIEFWVSFADVNELNQDLQYIIDKKFNDSKPTGYQVYFDNPGRMYFKVGDGTQTLSVSADLAWKVNKFYHVACTWDAETDTLKIYRDGVEAGSSTFAGSVIQNSTYEAKIGQRLGASYGAFNGTIDELRISNKAYIYAQPPVPPYTGGPYYGWLEDYTGGALETVALWTFNEDASSGLGRDGYALDLVSGHYYKAWISGYDEIVADGKFGWGLFGPGDQYSQDNANVQNGTEVFPDANDPSLSVECWVKFNDLTQDVQYLLDKRYTDKAGYEMYVAGNRVSFKIGDGTKVIATFADIDWQTGVYYHLAGTWDAQTDTAKLYRDGQLLAQSISPDSIIINNTRKLRIGNRLGASYWALDGVIDNVRVSSVAYEYAQKPVCGDDGTLLAGDISGPDGTPDCVVDIYDFTKFMQNWLTDTTPAGSTPDAFFAPAQDIASSYSPDEIYPQGQQFGFSFYSVDNPDVSNCKANGVTAIGPYYNEQELPLAYAKQLGLKMMYRVGLEIEDFTQPLPYTDQEITDLITAQVNAVKANTEIAWWYVTPEEPSNYPNRLRYMELAYNAIHAADELDRPVFTYEMNYRVANQMQETVAYNDICGKGSYANVHTAINMYTERAWVKWSIEQELAAIAGTPGNPNATPIMCSWMAADPVDSADDALIRDWVRHDLYLSFVTGAKGVVIWSGFRRTGFERTFDEYFNAYLSVANELNGELGLGEALLFGEKKDDLSVNVTVGPATVTVQSPSVADPDPYTTASVNFVNIADTTGGRYLIMVNSSNRNVTADVTGLPTSGVYTRDVFNSEDYVETTGGSFTADFAPLEVKCIRIVPEPQVCGDEGTVYPESDLTGPAGQKDCRVDIYDFASIASDWLACSDPDNPDCQ